MTDDAKTISKIEALAAANMKPVGANPCITWDAMVEARMARDNCARATAVDRLLAAGASDLWLKCCAWDAAQPKVIEQRGQRIKSGNWLNANPFGVARRIPRKP